MSGFEIVVTVLCWIIIAFGIIVSIVSIRGAIKDYKAIQKRLDELKKRDEENISSSEEMVFEDKEDAA